MFLRFVVGVDAQDAALLTGVIPEAARLRKEGRLYGHESELLAETFAWFNENLPCPPFSKKLHSEEWDWFAVCWFRSEAAASFIDRTWDIVAILREHGVPVRLLRSRDPGRILYADDYQVVAEPLFAAIKI